MASPPYSGTIPMGTLAIPPEWTSLPSAKRKRLRHDFIVVDRQGGYGVFLRVRKNLAATDPPLHTYSWDLNSDLNKIFAPCPARSFRRLALRRVLRPPSRPLPPRMELALDACTEAFR